jgi:luciferase family oxidoreductase group 1
LRWGFFISILFSMHNEAMTSLQSIAFSMLDLVAVREGGTVAQALAIATQTAQHAEQLGFKRYWVAEHHNMRGIASSATAVLVGHLASATRTIRIGSGGIMLPNHAPLVVAEAFGTLAELYPGRIDLGLGRAPGTDPFTMRALRRDRPETEQDFPDDVAELARLLEPAHDGQRIVATPGEGTRIPIWLLGSSLFSARLAAQRGLPYAFASHFAPGLLLQAIALYRAEFKPSAQLAKPYVMMGVPLFVAPTNEEAQYLASSSYQRVLGILTGKRGLLQPPVAGYLASLHPQERAAIAGFLAAAVIGDPVTAQSGLESLLATTQADELMFVSDIFDPALRLNCLSLVNKVRGR